MPPGDKHFLNALRRRIQALNVKPSDLGLDGHLYLLEKGVVEGCVDENMLRTLDDGVKQLEVALEAEPFLSPPDESSVFLGDYHVLNIEDGREVKFSFQPGRANQVYHICIFGNVGCGKSFLQAKLAIEAARDCYTFLIDSSRTFRHVKAMHDTHEFVRVEDLRLNPWDDIPGVPTNLSDAVVNKLIAKHSGLQYGEYELNEATAYFRKERGECPTLPSMIEYLEKKRYPPGSRRTYYRDSAVLGLRNIQNTSGDGSIYKCARGMDTGELLRGSSVLEISGLATSQAFISELLLTRVELLVYANVRLSKPLLFFMDEMQILLKAERNQLTSFLLGCRHLGVHLIMNFQNASSCPPELLSNSDALFCFKQLDERDRQVVKRLANLNDEQSVGLSGLEVGKCMAFFPKSDWKYPFLGSTPRLESMRCDDAALKESSRVNASRFSWEDTKSVETLNTGGTGEAKVETKGKTEKKITTVEDACEAFMADVMNREFEFSAATQRWERAGVRSASMQEGVLKKLLGDGLIQSDRLPMNLRGPSVVLYEPTAKAFAKYGVQWKSSGRGCLSTRAATFYLKTKLRKIPGLISVVEGSLNGKQVDVLCRQEDGSLTTIEIAGASGKHECHNALHCLSSNEVRKHIVACLGSKVLADVKRRFLRHDELKTNPRIEIVLFSKFMNEC
jgi:hypothetical protein